MVDVTPWIIAGIGWTLTIYFGLAYWRNSIVAKSFYDASVRLQRPIDLGDGRTGKMTKTKFGTYAIEWTQQIGGTLSFSGDLKARKIPKEENEEK